jgi:hypothetical protein
MNRRGFLTGMAGILAAGVAPAAVGSNILMPIRQIAVAPPIEIAGLQTEVALTHDVVGILSWFEKRPGGVWERKTRGIIPVELYNYSGVEIFPPRVGGYRFVGNKS